MAEYQVPEGIIVPGVSLGAVMHHDELRSQQTPTFSQNWNDHPPPQYFVADLPAQNDFVDDSPSKRQNMAAIQSPWDQQLRASPADMFPPPTASTTAQKAIAVPRSPPPKAKRVRTGCLTCRDRHLKCDEALPDCLNCRKRGRACKRGVRLNFLDINVHSLTCVPTSEEWAVQFHDESREIASEYRGGLRCYAPYDSERELPRDVGVNRHGQNERRHSEHGTQSMVHNFSSQAADNSDDAKASGTRAEHGPKPSPSEEYWANNQNPAILGSSSHSRTTSDASNIATPSSSSQSNIAYGAHSFQHLVTVRRKPSFRRRSDVSAAASILPQATITAPNETKLPVNNLPSENPTTPGREFLNTPEEIGYMQVFVEDVWVWMDSFDKEKHFSRLIPFYALKSTMLLNAFLACGVKHLSLSSPDENDKALFYYNTATSQLLRSLQNPDRNMAECAITAVILNVYEIMSEKPAHRMRHIGGARALILECRWDARSTGIGAACFWQNITMEVLICLSENWRTTWNPDDWGLDLSFFKEGEDRVTIEPDEVFVHRIIFVVAKIVNFRAAAAGFEEISPQDEQLWLRERLGHWHELKRLCDRWNHRCPRTMHPYGYMKPSKSTGDSAFPYIWMIKTAATLGRLLYHTAQCILSQSHPSKQITDSEGMRNLQLHHAHQVCGIAASTKDSGVIPMTIRCLAIAALVLSEFHEQAEVLGILERFKNQGGWHLGSVEPELKRAWGWERGRFPVALPTSQPDDQPPAGSHAMPPPVRAPAMMPMPNSESPVNAVMRVLTPPGVANPCVNPLSFADFRLPNHPYQNWYEPPNRTSPGVTNE